MTIFRSRKTRIKIEYDTTNAWGVDAHVWTHDVDLEASYAKLDRLLTEAVLREWPGAKVEVGLSASNSFTVDGERFSTDGVRLIEIIREVLLDGARWTVLK